MAMALHVFDSTASADSTDAQKHVHAIPINACESVLSDLLSSGATDVCCLVTAGNVPNPERLSDAVRQFESRSAAIGIVPGQQHSDLTYVWKRLPSPLAGLVMAPETRGAILIDTNRTVPSLSGSSDQPLRELVIRSAFENQDAVVLLESGDDADDSPLPGLTVELPELAPRHPGRDRNWLAQLLRQVRPHQYISGDGDDVEAEAVLAGLLQVNDYLDESHEHSQSIQGRGQDVNGDYWHGIMHRREPDYGNGKYWFRRVGHHPCFDLLPALADQALEECDSPEAGHWKSRLGEATGWDGATFIDFCQQAESSSDADLKTAAKRIQWAEMLLLLDHSFRQASRLQKA